MANVADRLSLISEVKAKDRGVAAKICLWRRDDDDATCEKQV